MVPLPLWSPRCAIAALMVCRCGPRATTAPMVCHHGPHAISSPPLCHGGARGAVPPTPTARCPRCAQSLCRVLCCPPRHLALRGDTADPPRAGMGTHVGLGWQPQPPRALGVRGPHGRIVLVLTPQWGSFGGVGGPGTAPLSVPPPIPWELCWQREGQKRTPLANSGRAVTVPGREGHGGGLCRALGGVGGGVGGGVFAPGCPHLIAEGGDAARCPPHCGPHG